jgi:hypothetical protein
MNPDHLTAAMKSFPVKIPTLWRQAFPAMMIGAAGSKLKHWLQGEPLTMPNTLPYMVVAAVVVAYSYFLQPTMAGPKGLKAMRTWGWRSLVAWTEITDVTFARYYLLQPSFRLVDVKGNVYWIARDTKDLKGLYATAKEFGGPDHPFTKALETPLFAV